MAEDEEKSKLKQLGPFGAAVAFLIFEFPLLPEIVFKPSKVMFTGIGAGGLLIGLGLGYFASKGGYFRLKRKGLLTLGALAVVLFAFTLRYFHIREDAENYYYETITDFFLINILIGFLLFLVGPAIRLALDSFGRDEE